MTIKEMVERDRAKHAEFTAEANGEPLRFLTHKSVDPDYPFTVIAPGVKANDGLFFEVDMRRGAIPMLDDEHVRRLIEYATSFGASFVLFAGPDLRFDIARVPDGWRLTAHFRFGDKQVQAYEAQSTWAAVEIFGAIENWIGGALSWVANKGGESS
jgi:Holliday junction resolvase